MSRIGLMPIKIEDGVSVSFEGGVLTAKGSLGEVKVVVPNAVKLSIGESEITLTCDSEIKKERSMHGTVRMLIANAVKGVKDGFERKLEVVGVGFRVRQEGLNISFSLGLNHPVVVTPPEGISLVVEGENYVTVKGVDKQKVGEVAAKIRELKKPEPYKGKGIRYDGEFVRRKSAKSVAK